MPTRLLLVELAPQLGRCLDQPGVGDQLTELVLIDLVQLAPAPMGPRDFAGDLAARRGYLCARAHYDLDGRFRQMR